jgi:hypothetical protein
MKVWLDRANPVGEFIFRQAGRADHEMVLFKSVEFFEPRFVFSKEVYVAI